LILRKKVVV